MIPQLKAAAVTASLIYKLLTTVVAAGVLIHTLASHTNKNSRPP